MDKRTKQIIEEAFNPNTVAARKLRHFDAIMQAAKLVFDDCEVFMDGQEYKRPRDSNMGALRTALSAYENDKD